MRVLVTAVARCWSRAETHIRQRGLHVRWKMALGTRYRAMRAKQREMSGSVIKARHILPRVNGMAGFAALRSWGCGDHPVAKLSPMWILVASRTRAVLKTISRDLAGAAHGPMTLAACDCNVTSGEGKTGVFVAGEGESRWPETAHRVAGFAAIEKRRCRELVIVRVLVAIGAEGEFQLVDSALPGRNMTFLARDRSVRSFERIRGRLVLGESELRRLEARHRMARGAFPCIGAFQKLSSMRIGPMTIGALLKSDRPLEIAAGMALLAAKQHVLS